MKFNAEIVNVVDGDTVDAIVDLGFRIKSKQRLRLEGLDTPERGQTDFLEAKKFLSNLVLDKLVVIETEKASKFGYFLATIFLNGEDINQKLLDSGLAKQYNGESKSWNLKMDLTAPPQSKS